MTTIRAALAAALTLFSSAALAADPALVAHFGFDEGAGAYAYDASGNQNHGAIDGATWTDGLVGRALRFDGATSNVRVPTSASLNVSTGLTIEAWVKLASNGGARVIVSKWDDPSGEWSYIFKKHNDQDGLRIELSQGGHSDLADLAGVEPLPLDRWLHVATTYDGAWVRLFVNGREDAAELAPGVLHASASDLLIGAVNPGAASEVFDGVIDEVSIFSRALSPAELAARFAALRPLLEAPVFEDGFDGAALDATRWRTDDAAAGARWCSDTVEAHHSNPGVWLAPSGEPCHGMWSPPSYGSVTVADGLASFAGSDAPAFPYVSSGAPVPGSPFPAAGDFRLDVRMRWDSITGHGTGLAVVRWPDTTPAGNNPPIPWAGGVLTLWADASTSAPRVGLLDGLVYGGAVVEPALALHDYALEYRGGAYAVRVDRGAWSAPAPSDVRADAIWVGNPVITFWGSSPWTAFSLDRVAVVALPLLAAVDVKPATYPNLVNVGGGGVVPVAILGSPALTVRDIVLSSIRVASAPVALRGKAATFMASYVDVNLDGIEDLVVQVEQLALGLSVSDEVAILDARLADGRVVRGADSIVVEP